MRKMRFILLFIAAAIGLTVASCISDDITNSASARLEFSTDTLSFDTVFTQTGTPTARLLVFNRGDKGVNISSISFKNPNSYFRMNVDGQSGKSFQNVEIRAKDSIYVFIECTLPENHDSKPTLIEEQLQFLTNGNEQSVVIEAWGQNVTRLNSVTIDKDMTLTAEQPYVVFDSLIVKNGATLNIEPGAQILFHDKAAMHIYGKINAVGSPGKMIDLRGDRLDNVLPNVGFDILAGQWNGIRIAPESFGNRLEYVDMRSTVSGLVLDSCAVSNDVKLTLVNSWLHNSQGNVLSAKYSNIDAYGCVFSESPLAVVSLTGGNHSFVQCTLANNYLFSAVLEPLLSLFHVNAENGNGGIGLPYMKADFENCIIYGLGADINISDLKNSEVYMRYVLFKSKGNDDEHFINCIWNEDPLFYTIRNDYYFNYRVKNDSPAIGAGNPAFVSQICLIDMDGLNRLKDGNPCLGAYVYVPEE
ncbi:MAG: hypothetical protein NC201_03930 [Prevotella sp.]|nr:hypothetical protein [Bacteroides sp.]MCM1366377.1 hypothetical protein [Prevotella sp.]MCM1436694.1 hypothetical protein [Prevotella sp.]